MIDDDIFYTSGELKRIMTFLLHEKNRARREQVYLPLFDTSRNGKIIVLRDPRESVENDRWIDDKRSAICNFSAEQNDVIQCNYNVRQSYSHFCSRLLVP